MSKATRDYIGLKPDPFLRQYHAYWAKTTTQSKARNIRAKALGIPKRDIHMYVAVDADKVLELHKLLYKLWYKSVSPYTPARNCEISRFADIKDAHKVVEREMKKAMKLISELIDDDDFFLKTNGQGEYL